MERITREEAANRGLKWFFTGMPCVHGHLSDRQTSNGTCRACGLRNYQKWAKVNRKQDPEYKKNHYYNNKAAYIEKAKIWNKANPDKRAELGRKYFAANRERINANARKRYALNPESIRAITIRYRSRKSANGGKVTGDDIKRIFKLQRGKCSYCRGGISNGYEIDHIKPVSKGGSGQANNIQLLCLPCNRSKSNKDADKFAREKGLLI